MESVTVSPIEPRPEMVIMSPKNSFVSQAAMTSLRVDGNLSWPSYRVEIRESDMRDTRTPTGPQPEMSPKNSFGESVLPVLP